MKPPYEPTLAMQGKLRQSSRRVRASEIVQEAVRLDGQSPFLIQVDTPDAERACPRSEGALRGVKAGSASHRSDGAGGAEAPDLGFAVAELGEDAARVPADGEEG
jgi:hypothetical protein